MIRTEAPYSSFVLRDTDLDETLNKKFGKRYQQYYKSKQICRTCSGGIARRKLTPLLAYRRLVAMINPQRIPPLDDVHTGDKRKRTTEAPEATSLHGRKKKRNELSIETKNKDGDKNYSEPILRQAKFHHCFAHHCDRMDAVSTEASIKDSSSSATRTKDSSIKSPYSNVNTSRASKVSSQGLRNALKDARGEIARFMVQRLGLDKILQLTHQFQRDRARWNEEILRQKAETNKCVAERASSSLHRLKWKLKELTNADQTMEILFADLIGRSAETVASLSEELVDASENLCRFESINENLYTEMGELRKLVVRLENCAMRWVKPNEKEETIETNDSSRFSADLEQEVKKSGPRANLGSTARNVKKDLTISKKTGEICPAETTKEISGDIVRLRRRFKQLRIDMEKTCLSIRDTKQESKGMSMIVRILERVDHEIVTLMTELAKDKYQTEIAKKHRGRVAKIKKYLDEWSAKHSEQKTPWRTCTRLNPEQTQLVEGTGNIVRRIKELERIVLSLEDNWNPPEMLALRRKFEAATTAAEQRLAALCKEGECLRGKDRDKEKRIAELIAERNSLQKRLKAMRASLVELNLTRKKLREVKNDREGAWKEVMKVRDILVKKEQQINEKEEQIAEITVEKKNVERALETEIERLKLRLVTVTATATAAAVNAGVREQQGPKVPLNNLRESSERREEKKEEAQQLDQLIADKSTANLEAKFLVDLISRGVLSKYQSHLSVSGEESNTKATSNLPNIPFDEDGSNKKGKVHENQKKEVSIAGAGDDGAKNNLRDSNLQLAQVVNDFISMYDQPRQDIQGKSGGEIQTIAETPRQELKIWQKEIHLQEDRNERSDRSMKLATDLKEPISKNSQVEIQLPVLLAQRDEQPAQINKPKTKTNAREPDELPKCRVLEPSQLRLDNCQIKLEGHVAHFQATNPENCVAKQCVDASVDIQKDLGPSVTTIPSPDAVHVESQVEEADLQETRKTIQDTLMEISPNDNKKEITYRDVKDKDKAAQEPISELRGSKAIRTMRNVDDSKESLSTDLLYFSTRKNKKINHIYSESTLETLYANDREFGEDSDAYPIDLSIQSDLDNKSRLTFNKSTVDSRKNLVTHSNPVCNTDSLDDPTKSRTIITRVEKKNSESFKVERDMSAGDNMKTEVKEDDVGEKEPMKIGAERKSLNPRTGDISAYSKLSSTNVQNWSLCGSESKLKDHMINGLLDKCQKVEDENEDGATNEKISNDRDPRFKLKRACASSTTHESYRDYAGSIVMKEDRRGNGTRVQREGKFIPQNEVFPSKILHVGDDIEEARFVLVEAMDEIQALKTELIKLRTEKTGLKNQLDIVGTQLDSLKTERHALKDELFTSRKINSSLRMRANNLQATYEKINRINRELRGDVGGTSISKSVDMR